MKCNLKNEDYLYELTGKGSIFVDDNAVDKTVTIYL